MDLTEFGIQADRDGELVLMHHPCGSEEPPPDAMHTTYITGEEIVRWMSGHVCRTVIEGQVTTT